MFKILVLSVIKDHHCPVIGLEIASDQQITLDAVMLGKSSVKQIKLWPSLNHAAYRRMIENFAEFKRNGQCIRVIAIDSGMENNVDRDQWLRD